MKRSMYAGRVREEHIGTTITLKGWVGRRRDLGGLIFIDLRDREGVMQLVINPEDVSSDVMATAERLRSEYVIEVEGLVEARQQANDKLATGMVELKVSALTILNTAKTTPFEIKDDVEVSDDTRLRYRYLDLRRPEMLENFKLRAKVTHSIRNYLDDLEFIDVETPMLTKSTPEGARLERLLLVLDKQGVSLPIQEELDVYIAVLGEDVNIEVLSLVQAIRQQGFSVERDYLYRKIKAQFKSADAFGARFVITLGTSEVESNQVTVKNNQTRSEITVSLEELKSDFEKVVTNIA